MTVRLANVTFDCDQPPVVAGFWSEVLGLDVDDGASDFFVSLGANDPSGPTWLFLMVDESKSAKNRCHVDLESDDYPAEVDRLVALGATKVADKAEWGHTWTVFNDPEGNEFCMSGPHA